jgi:transcriptional regulator with XRE-family HTH domain
MNIHGKLRSLLKNMNKSAVCKSVNLSVATLEGIIGERRSIPNANTALKLARALGVDPGWLIDDSKGWPPVRVEKNEEAAAAA